MIHPDQIQSLDKSNHGREGRKRGKKQRLKKKGPMEVERKAKNPVASGGGGGGGGWEGMSLDVEDSIRVLEPPKG